uniref:Reverse transcriptase domain-containing protein n=1 Tax=Oreochromis niloticus TaxID=8128 RepID=A0A669EVJ2_ORENI
MKADREARVHICDKVSEEFPIMTGVWQGDMVSPLLFNIVTDAIMRKLNAEKTKVLTTDGSPAIVHLDGVQIEQVQQFKYLGSLIEEKKVASSIDLDYHFKFGTHHQ